MFPPKTKHVSGSQQAWLGSASSLVAALLPGYRKISKLVQLFSYFWIEKNPPKSQSRGRQRPGSAGKLPAGRQPQPGSCTNGPFDFSLLSPSRSAPGRLERDPQLLPCTLCPPCSAPGWELGAGVQGRGSRGGPSPAAVRSGSGAVARRGTHLPQEQFRRCFNISQNTGNKRNFNGV